MKQHLCLARTPDPAAAAEGALPTIKLGRRLLVPIARLDEFLGERKP